MPINITMPALSPTMQTGTLAKWLKADGDSIRSGDTIAEIETDKATMEVEAVDDGVLKILVPAGTANVSVHEVIGILAAEHEEVEIEVAQAGQAGEVNPAIVVNRAETPGVASEAPTAKDRREVDRILASPLARRLAREAGINLAKLTGSGPRWRVIARDVEAAIESSRVQISNSHTAFAAHKSPALTDALSDPQTLFEADEYEVIPHDAMREAIARRLSESKRAVPHFYLTVGCALNELLKLRNELNGAAPCHANGTSAYKLSVNDFVIKALARALMEVPDANVTWTEDGMLKHRHADIAVAVAIPGGLVTPIVRRAEIKTLSSISNEMKALAERGRNRKLQPHEFQGGSTAISNLGMFGIREFAAVINPPHATILAVGSAEGRAVVRNAKIEIETEMSVTLSADHRAIDGAVGAMFLAAFKQSIEQPIRLIV